jgi:DNA-binding CsgD family transcriptional regulator
VSDPALPRCLEAWRAYLAAGSMKEAAARLGIHEVTVRKRIATLRDIYGVDTTAQLAVAIERDPAA